MKDMNPYIVPWTIIIFGLILWLFAFFRYCDSVWGCNLAEYGKQLYVLNLLGYLFIILGLLIGLLINKKLEKRGYLCLEANKTNRKI